MFSCEFQRRIESAGKVCRRVALFDAIDRGGRRLQIVRGASQTATSPAAGHDHGGRGPARITSAQDRPGDRLGTVEMRLGADLVNLVSHGITVVDYDYVERRFACRGPPAHRFRTPADGPAPDRAAPGVRKRVTSRSHCSNRSRRRFFRIARSRNSIAAQETVLKRRRLRMWMMIGSAASSSPATAKPGLRRAKARNARTVKA